MSRFVSTTRATNTDLCQHARRTGERSYVQALRPSPVGVPRLNPGGSSPGAGGVKPSTPVCQARSAWPSSANTATNAAALFDLDIEASSAVQAESSEEYSEMAAPVAPCVRSDSHWSLRRPASSGCDDCRFVLDASNGQDPAQR